MYHPYILLLIACRERPTEEDELKDVKEKVSARIKALDAAKDRVVTLKAKMVELNKKQIERERNFTNELNTINADTESIKIKITDLNEKIRKFNNARERIASKCGVRSAIYINKRQSIILLHH